MDKNRQIDTSREYVTTDQKRLRKETKPSKVKRNPVGVAFHLKFPINPHPETVAEYQERKVNLISRKKFLSGVSKKPEDLFVGSMKVG